MCCGLLAALSWSSRVPAYLPRLCGANSTEIVHVPPFAAIVVHVLAVTLNGGVAAGAVVNLVGSGRSVTSGMVWGRSGEHTSAIPSHSDIVWRLLLGKKKKS